MTQAEKKYIKQLRQKKYRNLYKEFIVEGSKSILSFLEAGWKPVKLFQKENIHIYNGINTITITEKELKSISSFKNPKDALAIFKMRKPDELPEEGIILALDNLQDPGNLGTIIRTADWFGVKHIVCSKHTVDCYNPKVVQAAMGSLARIRIHYTDLQMYLKQTKLPVYGTFLEGNNMFEMDFPNKMIVVIGNEANGIRPELRKYIKQAIHIPKQSGTLAESLNASIAAALLLCYLRF